MRPPVHRPERGAREALVGRLARAGCVAADEEAEELLDAAGGDIEVLEGLVRRREVGEPLAWITGWVPFAGLRIRVVPGVYVPRWETWPLALRAVDLLGAGGLAVDLCTGTGAVAAVLAARRPRARVVATDVDALACRCARTNGVEVYEGDLADPLPGWVRGGADVVTAVTPYVPTGELVHLPHDSREHEPVLALDGGPGGTRILAAAAKAAAGLLRPGGTLLLELGGDQDQDLAGVLTAAGYGARHRLLDEDGDLRGIEARWTPSG